MDLLTGVFASTAPIEGFGVWPSDVSAEQFKFTDSNESVSDDDDDDDELPSTAEGVGGAAAPLLNNPDVALFRAGPT